MLVQIIDPAHPHHGEYGTWSEEITVVQGMMHEIILQNCLHGSSGCFAMRKQVQEVKE